MRLYTPLALFQISCLLHVRWVIFSTPCANISILESLYIPGANSPWLISDLNMICASLAARRESSKLRCPLLTGGTRSVRVGKYIVFRGDTYRTSLSSPSLMFPKGKNTLSRLYVQLHVMRKTKQNTHSAATRSTVSGLGYFTPGYLIGQGGHNTAYPPGIALPRLCGYARTRLASSLVSFPHLTHYAPQFPLNFIYTQYQLSRVVFVMPGAVLYGASLGVFVGGMLRHHYSAFVSGGGE